VCASDTLTKYNIPLKELPIVTSSHLPLLIGLAIPDSGVVKGGHGAAKPDPARVSGITKQPTNGFSIYMANNSTKIVPLDSSHYRLSTGINFV
jgi:hypothetical protein